MFVFIFLLVRPRIRWFPYWFIRSFVFCSVFLFCLVSCMVGFGRVVGGHAASDHAPNILGGLHIVVFSVSTDYGEYDAG